MANRVAKAVRISQEVSGLTGFAFIAILKVVRVLKEKPVFILLGLACFLIIGGVYLVRIRTSVPAPVVYKIPADWKETQKTLVSGIKIDFKHPPDWSDDLAHCRPSESGEEDYWGERCATVRFLSPEKTKELAKSISGETINVGGKRAIREIKNGKIKSYSVLAFDSVKKPFVGLVAYFGEDENRETLNKILSTFRFVKPKKNTLGTVTGELCYSAKEVPPGIVAAKDIASNKVYTLDYPGTKEGAARSYSFDLYPGDYLLKYEGYGISAYYTGTRCVDKNDWGCRKEYHHQLETVKVEAGKTIKMVDLCDFYYLFNQIRESEIGF